MEASYLMGSKKMKKTKTAILILFVSLLSLSVTFGQITDIKANRETVDLKDFYVISKAISAADVLQFMQVYEAPDSPVEFFTNASYFDNEEIEKYFAYYLSFFNPQSAYKFSYKYFADRKSYFEVMKVIPEDKDYSINEAFSNFTSLKNLQLIFPSGIVDGNIYDVFRTCSRQLAFYVGLFSPDGRTPDYELCEKNLQEYYQSLELDFQTAMEEEEKLKNQQ